MLKEFVAFLPLEPRLLYEISFIASQTTEPVENRAFFVDASWRQVD